MHLKSGEEREMMVVMRMIVKWPWESVNWLSLNSDQRLISPNNNTAWSNRQVMRINEMITKDEMLWSYNKFSQAVP